jgi:CRP-like cAMP-binding protein
MYSTATRLMSQPVNQEQVLAKLRRIRLFNRLTSEQLFPLAEWMFESHYDKETVIFHESDLPSETGRKIYFVHAGCIKLVKYSSDGESTIVRLVAVGEFFGVTGALTNQELPFSAIALTDTNVLTMDSEHFKQAVHLYPDLALDMVVALGEVLWFNYETHNQVVKKTDARVAKILLYHLNRDGHQDVPEGKLLNIQLPHDYIASMTGIAYEESVRIVSRLKKQHGCIQYLRGGKIILTNVAKLKELTLEGDSWGV